MTFPRKFAHNIGAGHRMQEDNGDDSRRVHRSGTRDVGRHGPGPNAPNVHVNVPPSNSIDHGEDLTWMDTVFGGISQNNGTLTSRHSFASRNSFTSRHSFTSRGSFTGMGLDQHNLESCGISKLLDVEASRGNEEEHEGDKKPKAQPPPSPLKGDAIEKFLEKEKIAALSRDRSNGTGSSKNSSNDLSCSGLSSLEISGDSSDVEAALTRAESAAAAVDSISANSNGRKCSPSAEKQLAHRPSGSELDHSHHLHSQRVYEECSSSGQVKVRVGGGFTRRFRSLEDFNTRGKNEVEGKPMLDGHEYSARIHHHNYDYRDDHRRHGSINDVIGLQVGTRSNERFRLHRNSVDYDAGFSQRKGFLMEDRNRFKDGIVPNQARAIVQPSPPVDRPTVLKGTHPMEINALSNMTAPIVPSLVSVGGIVDPTMHNSQALSVVAEAARSSVQFNQGTLENNTRALSASQAFQGYETAPQVLPSAQQQISPHAPPFPAVGPSGYIDYSNMSDNAVAAHFGMMIEDRLPSTTTVQCPFPQRLHEMLTENKFPDVVSWSPHGRAFVVRRTKEFETTVLPLYFKQTKYRSFQRQLNLYGFRRITHNEADRGGYYHELFLRGRRRLCTRIKRQGTNQYRKLQQQQQQVQQEHAASMAAAHNERSPCHYNVPSGFMSFMGEPNFYAMEPLTESNVPRNITSSGASSNSTIVVPLPETIAQQGIVTQRNGHETPSPLPLNQARSSHMPVFWMAPNQPNPMLPPRRPKYRDRRNADAIVFSSTHPICDCGCNCGEEGLSHAHVVDPAS